MSFAFEHRLDPRAAAVRARILNALPAGGYQMDRFFQLLDLELSHEIETAAVRCGERPKLLMNPQFLERYCQSDEHLFLLVMHELMHVVLGHTRLFLRPTIAHNIAFDAVINALLCRQFSGPDYVGFFQKINGWDQFPGRLLRPAPGWPANPAPMPAKASETERRLHERLYGADSKDVTYHEIFELLAVCLRETAHARASQSGGLPSGASQPGRASKAGEARAQDDAAVPEPTLLGSHGSQDDEDATANDPTLVDVLRRAVADWPAPYREIGRDRGTPALQRDLSSDERAEPELVAAIERLFQRAGLKEARTSRTRRREVASVPVAFSTVVPQLGDRRARTRGLLLRTPAVFYEGQRASRRVIRSTVCRAFVYLDISGSMDSVLPWLLAALRGPVRDGAARLFVFSTIVEEVDPRSLRNARARTTGGTDIDCVLRHIITQSTKHCPRRVVVVTDGWVGAGRKEYWNCLRHDNIEVIAGLTPPGYRRDLEKQASYIEALPAPRNTTSAAPNLPPKPRL